MLFSNHKCLKKLINDVGLTKQIIEIPSKASHIVTKSKWKKNEISNYSPYDFLDIIIKKTKLTKKMKKMSFGEWLNKNIDPDIVDYLKAIYPYKDIFKTNAYDALNLYSTDLNNNNTFYVLGGGSSQLVEVLSKRIKSTGGIIKLNTELVSLDDIEHKILRSKYKSPYIHYMLNCASMSCPNLQATSWKADNLEADQLMAATEYINSSRAVTLKTNGLQLSSIYKWFKEDFENDGGVLDHILTHANKDLKNAIERGVKIKSYNYDWTLNDVTDN